MYWAIFEADLNITVGKSKSPSTYYMITCSSMAAEFFEFFGSILVAIAGWLSGF
jgi:hypothetical protein